MHDSMSQKASSSKAKKKGGKKNGKPAWAVTEQMQEDAKEKEIDDLLEFAYELDYEKYMEDYEVRQALAIIKDRVAEITNQEGWKEKLVDEWNAAQEEENAQAHVKERKRMDMDSQSKLSYCKFYKLTHCMQNQKPRKQATLIGFLKRRKRLLTDLTGTSQLLLRSGMLMLKTEWRARLLRKCSETTQSCARSTQGTQ